MLVNQLVIALPRQATEKSKGTWVEKPLSALEEEYKTEEDRAWLKSQIVDSQALSHVGTIFHMFGSYCYSISFLFIQELVVTDKGNRANHIRKSNSQTRNI